MTEEICICGHGTEYHIQDGGCMYPEKGIVNFDKVKCPCKKFTKNHSLHSGVTPVKKGEKSTPLEDTPSASVGSRKPSEGTQTQKGCGKRVNFSNGSFMYNCGNRDFKLCPECSNQTRQGSKVKPNNKVGFPAEIQDDEILKEVLGSPLTGDYIEGLCRKAISLKGKQDWAEFEKFLQKRLDFLRDLWKRYAIQTSVSAKMEIEVECNLIKQKIKEMK